ncbi:GNAT family N-acetyltransferase [Jiella avicenniae]|uniref:GNAT family N-acetyltransferase n=1 Tax=Jiella avicenniae TaxID=2907202 RepID=A0A9X1P5V4_9HYPH|nr:GNAT family N-acetyltransferase [Jiella avicenniae]MCE7030394.1 GNAT family N-acetyltransferase [Jiella avicenniae]
MADLHVTIRSARETDLNGVNALMNMPNYRRGTLRLPHESLATTKRRLLEPAPNVTLLVAEEAGAILGTANLTRLTNRRSHVGQVGIGVHDGHLRRGIAAALLCELLSLADDWLGLVRLELDVMADNLPAIALYEKHGFAVEGRLRATVLREGDFVDTLSMARLREPPRRV